MSQENVEIVRAAMEGFTEAGWERAKDRYSPDIVWEVRPDLPDAGIYEGYEGVGRLRARWAEALDESWVEPIEYIPVGEDAVVVPLRWGGRGKASGVEFEESGETWVFSIRGGKVARVREFATREQALRAARLRD